MYGTVVSVDDDAYELEIDADVIVRFVKAAVTRLAPEEPAKDDDSTGGEAADDDLAAVGEPVTLAKTEPADARHRGRSSSEG
jgi:hypothetical protein